MKCAWCGGALTPLGCECVAGSRLGPARPCACCGSPHLTGAKFCAECGATYVGRLAGEAAIERRQITFLFCDLVGSTALSEGLDPEDYKDILVPYRNAIHAAMQGFGGWVDRFRGDGTLVYFGYPEAHEDDAERAMQAALESIRAVGSLPPLQQRKLQVRIGIATGLAVISDVEDPWERTAMGEVPNIAARLQGLAEPDSAVVDSASRRLVGDLFAFRDLGPVRVKGLTDPIQAWSLVGAQPVASRFEARRKQELIALVGRDEEIRVLHHLWQQARAGRGKIAVVSGEAGIGKSRLAASLLDRARQEGGAVATYRYFCSPYRQGSALHPCIRQLEHAAGFTASDTLETRLGKLDAILAGASREDRALIGELLNLPVPDPGVVAIATPHGKRRRTMQALLNLLERVSRQMPALLVFEDAQWADDSSRELLRQVAGLVPRLPIFLLVLTRPVPFTAFDADVEVTRLALHPLPPSLGAQLAREVAGSVGLPPSMVADIVARTDGIPLFIEELTGAVLEDRARSESLPGYLDTPTLPMLLRATLLPRLNRLGAAREVLEVAAAIGREFSLHLLALVLAGRDDLGQLLDRLVDSGIVLRQAGSEPVFSFKHALIRDAMYEILGRDARRRLHGQVAAAIEQNLPEVVANHPEVLAWHFTGAGQPEKAVAHWLLAGRNALRRSAMAEALNHLQRGMAVAAGTDPSPWRLQNELALTICTGMAQIATQGYAVPGTGETFGRARVLCEQLGDPPPLLAVLHGLWTHSLLRAEFEPAQQRAAEILARGEAKGDPLWRLMGRRFTGVTCHPLGRFAEAIAHLRAGLALYDPAQRATYAAITVDDPRVVMMTYLSWSQMCAGQLEDAIRNSAEATAEARQAGHVYTLAHALNGEAFIALTVLSPQAGLAKLDELDAAIADAGIAYYKAVGTIFRAWCLAGVGRHEEALQLLAHGIPSYRATHSMLYLPGFLRMAAEAHVLAGRAEAAMRLVEEAEALVRATGQRWDEAEIHRVRGVILREAGRVVAAGEAFHRAWTVAREQGALLWELRACCELAQGPVPEPGAIARLQSLLAGYDDRLDLPDLRRARSLAASTPATTLEARA